MLFKRSRYGQTHFDLERLVLFNQDVEKNRKVVAEAEDTIAIATAAAAVVIGDEIPLSLASDPHVMWRNSPLFGTPFCAAVFAGKFYSVLHAVRSLESAGYPADINIAGILMDGAMIAMHKENPQIAEIILSFVESKKLHTFSYSFALSHWLDKWVSRGYPSLVLVILAVLNAEPNSPLCIRAFIKACEEGSVTVVYHLISMGKVNVNQAMSHFGMENYAPQTRNCFANTRTLKL